jgi:hypothetical protein
MDWQFTCRQMVSADRPLQASFCAEVGDLSRLTIDGQGRQRRGLVPFGPWTGGHLELRDLPPPCPRPMPPIFHVVGRGAVHASAPWSMCRHVKRVAHSVSCTTTRTIAPPTPAFCLDEAVDLFSRCSRRLVFVDSFFWENRFRWFGLNNIQEETVVELQYSSRMGHKRRKILCDIL